MSAIVDNPTAKRAITKRLAWKETAMLRPICTGCLVLLALILALSLTTSRNAEQHAEFVLNVTISLGCLAALALAIPLFVLERESGTDMFLDSFPIDGRHVANTKLTRVIGYFAAFMTGAIALGFAALAIYEQGVPSFQGIRMPLVWLGLIVLTPTLCLMWSLVCSLIFRNGLHATIAAVVFTAASSGAIWIATTGLSGTTNLVAAQVVLAANAILCLLLAGTVWYLSPCWLRGRPRTAREKIGAKVATISSARTITEPMQTSYPWQALLWQNVRRSWIWWSVAAVSTVVSSHYIGRVVLQQIYYHGDFGPASHSLFLTGPVFIIAGAWIGTLMFSSDQSKSKFLFFQQRADYPRQVWFARFCIVLLFLPVVWMAGTLMHSDITISVVERNLEAGNYDRASWTSPLQSIPDLMIMFLAAAGLAQLVTISFRIGSGFISFIATIFLCGVLLAGCQEITYRGESLLVFLTPISIACFFATWWQAPRWISGRAKKRGTAASLALCGFVLAATCTGWIWHRVSEFGEPPTAGTLAAEWIAFAEADNLQLARANYPAAVKLEKAIQNIEATDEEKVRFPTNLTKEQYNDWYSRNDKSLAEISESLKDKECGLFLNPRSKVERENQKKRLLQILDAATRRHQGQLEVELEFEALEDRLRTMLFVSTDLLCETTLLEVCDWATRDGNDEATIRKAIKTIGELELEVLDPSNINSGSDSFGAILYRESVLEVQRKFGSSSDSDHASGFAWEVERRRRGNLWALDHSGRSARRRKWSIPLLQELQSNTIRTPMSSGLETAGVLQNMLRYTQTRLALAGWKLENGSWPERLDLLCEGENPWLEKLPLCAFRQQEFAYSGKGADDIVFCDAEYIPPPMMYHYNSRQAAYVVNAPETEHWIEPKQPFLLPWPGAVNEKRSFVPIEQVDESESARATEKTKAAYWIPVGPAREINMLIHMKKYLLE